MSNSNLINTIKAIQISTLSTIELEVTLDNPIVCVPPVPEVECLITYQSEGTGFVKEFCIQDFTVECTQAGLTTEERKLVVAMLDTEAMETLCLEDLEKHVAEIATEIALVGVA